MRIIPVIDIQRGVVVHAVRGERERYQPLTSLLTDSPAPGAVARAFRERLGLEEVYVADLDAIGGAAPDDAALRDIAAAGLSAIVDAGVGTKDAAERWREWPCVSGVVAALESSPSPESLAGVCEILGPARAVFSLDLRHGQPLTTAPAWAGQTPEAIVRVAVGIGYRRLIVLDLARVGANQGPGVERLCDRVRQEHPHLELIAGGGVRNAADLQRLAAAGCAAALVASALHDGRITPADGAVA